jgi:hypothetical protein
MSEKASEKVIFKREPGAGLGKGGKEGGREESLGE